MAIEIETAGPDLLVSWTKELEEYFIDKDIHLGYPWRSSEVLADGHRIRMRKDIVAEQYSNQPLNRICDFGAFSCCRTTHIDPTFKLGRFSYVGDNVKLFRRGGIDEDVLSLPPAVRQRAISFWGEELGAKFQTVLAGSPESAPVIGHDVKIGDGVAIARGIRIGNGAIVRPYSVVLADVPAFAIVEGNPAKVVGFRFASDEVRARVLNSKWWEYTPDSLPMDLTHDVSEFLDRFDKLKEAGELVPANYAKVHVGRDLIKQVSRAELSSPIETKSATPTWHEFVQNRIEGNEKNVPWFLHDKLKCYEYLEENGIATVKPLRVFKDPKTIVLDGLPNTFVIKPSLQSSTKGVMVLARREDGSYWDELRRRVLTADEVKEEQEKYFNETKASGRSIIVEPKIEDLEAKTYSIPRDFKAYAFRGEVALILEIDRNTKPASVTWFDGKFNPVNDNRVVCNEEFVHMVSKMPPGRYQEILDLAEKASACLPTPFASVDMYLTQEGPLIGEITLAPGGLYHGKHYKMSEEQERLMGGMWAKAKMQE